MHSGLWRIISYNQHQTNVLTSSSGFEIKVMDNGDAANGCIGDVCSTMARCGRHFGRDLLDL